MSGYTEKIRSELTGRLPAASCCRRSMLAGMLINSEPGKNGALYIRISGSDVFGIVRTFVSELYGRQLEAEEKNCYGSTVYEAVAYSDTLSSLIGSLSDPAHISEPPKFFGCRHCKTFFMAGMMMTSVTVSDPSKSSRAELKLSDPALTPKLDEFFLAEGLTPSVSYRKGTGSLLFRKSEDIESLVGLSGAKNACLDIMQAKLMREFRGDINRKANCDLANIAKAAASSEAQRTAIENLKKHGGFPSLPEDLRETAELRLEHPEASLSELASLHEPPISKSGLNHRLKKLAALAEESDY
ncbi:MAG: DNA-binding protein WhiA [Clostridia bacterium]|nr:DNA-binding protein WhiA [Clostridia bacterium]